jgi:hypothetical protein
LVERRDGVEFYINEFWTPRRRQVHAPHETATGLSSLSRHAKGPHGNRIVLARRV